MRIIGVTGQIGMGKSVVARMFKHFGLWIYDADRQAHLLLRNKEVIADIRRLFGGPKSDSASDSASKSAGKSASDFIDRSWLREQVLGDKQKLRQLESILHPLLASHVRRFLLQARLHRCWGVVLDVPLLFEKGACLRCHWVFVASCRGSLQYERLRRRGLSNKEIDRFISLQMSDKEKRKKADFVIPTDLGYHHTWRFLCRIFGRLAGTSVDSRLRLSGYNRSLRHRLEMINHA